MASAPLWARGRSGVCLPSLASLATAVARGRCEGRCPRRACPAVVSFPCCQVGVINGYLDFISSFRWSEGRAKAEQKAEAGWVGEKRSRGASAQSAILTNCKKHIKKHREHLPHKVAGSTTRRPSSTRTPGASVARQRALVGCTHQSFNSAMKQLVTRAASLRRGQLFAVK